MKLKPNTTSILTKVIEHKERKTAGGLIINESQDKNSKQCQVLSIGSKVSKQLELTTDSIVILSGGTPITVDDIQYIVANEAQIVAIIN